MTEQHALFPEPHWTDDWQVGDRVRSRYTSNIGTVVTNDGRRLAIKWERWLPREPNGYVARHSSDHGIEKLS